MYFLHNSQFFCHSEDKGKENIERGECRLGSKLGRKSWSDARLSSQFGEIGPTWLPNGTKYTYHRGSSRNGPDNLRNSALVKPHIPLGSQNHYMSGSVGMMKKAVKTDGDQASRLLVTAC